MGDIINFRAKDTKEKAERVKHIVPDLDVELSSLELADIYDQAEYSVQELTDEVMQCEHEVTEFIAEKIKERGNLVPLLGMLNYLESLPFPKDKLYDIILSQHIQDIIKGTGNNDDKPKT